MTHIPLKDVQAQLVSTGHLACTFHLSFGLLTLTDHDGLICLTISSRDDRGDFTCKSFIPVSDFLDGDDGWLDSLIRDLLWNRKHYG